jgi:hypothetical protein
MRKAHNRTVAELRSFGLKLGYSASRFPERQHRPLEKKMRNTAVGLDNPLKSVNHLARSQPGDAVRLLFGRHHRAMSLLD